MKLTPLNSKMNTTQMKYALARVGEVAARKTRELQDALTTPAKDITEKERAELVRSGKVKLHSHITAISSYADVVNVFDFSKYTHGKIISPEFTKEAGDIATQADRIRDQIMLGDESVAMKLLEAFAAS